MSSIVILAGCGRNPETYMKKGDTLFAAGNNAEAELNYRKATQTNPNLGEAYRRLAQAELKQNKGAGAYRSLSRAAELLPNNQEVLVSLAELSLSFYLMDPGRPKQFSDAAARIADRILAKDAQSVEGLRLRGSVALANRRPEEALQYFRNADAIQPGTREVAIGITEALLQAGRTAEAEQSARDSLGRNKTIGPLYDLLYQMLRTPNRAADAEKILRAKVDAFPNDAAALLQLAGHYAQVRSEAEMNTVLKRLLDRPGDFPRAHLLVGNFYAGAGRWPEAIKTFKEGAVAEPEGKRMYQGRVAAAWIAQGKIEEAEPLVQGILKENPQDLDGRLLRATIWAKTGTPETLDRAIQELQAVAALKPDDVSLHNTIGEGLLRQGNLDGARKELLEARKRSPAYVPARLTLAEISYTQRRPEETIQFADEVIALRPGYPSARMLRAMALRAMGQLAEARSEFARLIKEFPGFREARQQLGMVAIAQQKYSEADAIFMDLRERDSGGDPRPTFGLVQSFSARNDFAEAIREVASELKKSPQSVPLQRLLVETAIRGGQFDLAVEEGRRLVGRRPDSVEASLLLGDAYSLKGDYANAIQVLEKVKLAEPKNPAPLALLASAYESAGRQEEAKTNYRLALRMQAGQPEASNNLAFLLAESGVDLDEALKLAQQALAKAPNQPNFLDTLGYVYLKKNMGDTALQIFRNLTDKQPDNPTFRYHLGKALLSKGAKAEARQELQTALTKRPKQAEAAQIQALLSQIQ